MKFEKCLTQGLYNVSEKAEHQANKACISGRNTGPKYVKSD